AGATLCVDRCAACRFHRQGHTAESRRSALCEGKIAPGGREGLACHGKRVYPCSQCRLLGKAMSHDLFLAAKAAMSKAYAPYSRFPVGAALRTEDGREFAGANIEVASFPEVWCAETTALGHYIIGGAGKITEIAVIAERMAKFTPRVGCRQRVAEFCSPD